MQKQAIKGSPSKSRQEMVVVGGRIPCSLTLSDSPDVISFS